MTELNRRKSLLTPAAPTAWGMIYGDIEKQTDIIEKINDIVKSSNVDLTGYATETWVEEQGYITEHQSLEDYYTKSEVDDKIDNIEVDGDLTGYATESWVKQQGYLTETEMNDKYTTEMKNYVNEQIGGTNTILDNMNEQLGDINANIGGFNANINNTTAQIGVLLEYTKMNEINTITDDILQ